MKKSYYYVMLIPILLLLGGTEAPKRHLFDLNSLSGNITLTLKHGVWKKWKEEPVYQNMTLDLVCDRGECQEEIWGYAPKYNQEVDHLGKITQQTTDNLWNLQIKLNIQPHPWNTKVEQATYNIKLIPHQEGLIGSYEGEFNERKLKGKVNGEINPLWPIPVENHQLIPSQEHPRLAFRKSDLPRLREKAKTPVGQAILRQLERSLQNKVYYQAYVPNGGYHAAGHCFLALLRENSQESEKAWQLVENSLKNPENTLLKQSPIVAGVALAYDLCYNSWSLERREKITKWLNSQTYQLIRGDSPKNGWNGNAASNWNARARGAAGLAALAIMDEPSLSPTDPHLSAKSQAMIAQRNLKRYLQTAIGDRGFGTEGDHYTTEPWVLSVIPFLIAYRNVMGQDLIKNAQPEWFLPHYLMRAIPKEDLSISTYGRHRSYLGGSLFATGLELVSESSLPSILWLFDQQLGLKGNQTFGINSPHEAIFTFISYPETFQIENPDKRYDKVFVDKKKGFYSFRNRWQNENDIVSSIYLKKDTEGGSWSFPDVGSFRILGLGEKWAIAGFSKPEREQENVVILPKIKPWKKSDMIHFDSRLNGSGIVSLLSNDIVAKEGNQGFKTAWLRAFGVDYSGSSGSPALFVIVDQFLGDFQAQPFDNKTWVMQTEGEVMIQDKTFMIKGKNGTSLKGVFIAPEFVKISYEKNELGGKIKATGGDYFFVVMTIQKGETPEFKITPMGLNSTVKVGQQTIQFDGKKVFFSKFD